MNYALEHMGNGIKTMTLKEITDLMDVRHNNAMKTVELMMREPEFGSAAKIQYHLPAGYKVRAQTIETYQLDKRQSIAVAARLNVALLMRIVDRWQALEEKQHALSSISTLITAEVSRQLTTLMQDNGAPAQLTQQEAREADVINYLKRKGDISGREFQCNRTRAKPWTSITPRSAIGAAMRATFAVLEQKGVITRCGRYLSLTTIH